MAALIWDTDIWATQNFETCQLGNRARNRRLMIIAKQLVSRSASSLPDQTEGWKDCKGAYRFFDTKAVSFQKIIAPHCRLTRQSAQPGAVKLIINDTTEIDYTSLRKTTGLGPIGNGKGRGFFLHSALMVDVGPQHQVDGLVAQEVFYRKVSSQTKKSKNSQRSKPDRESAVWGRVFDAVGRPPEGVTYKQVCDRGADDIEVMWRAIHNGCGFVIRASHLNRKVMMTADGPQMSLREVLANLPAAGATRTVIVPATKNTKQRTATMTLRYGTVWIPLSATLTPWLKEHRPQGPLSAGVVELREENPPAGQKAIRWVLFTDNPLTCEAEANQAVEYYEQRWSIEEFHKALKTGCGIERRQLQKAERLENVVAVSSVVAVRLLQLKTAARETPQRPARELVPTVWIELLQKLRERPVNLDLTIHAFLREMAGLGGFLGRKGDGEPGWITIWRGFEKLGLMVRALHAMLK